MLNWFGSKRLDALEVSSSFFFTFLVIICSQNREIDLLLRWNSVFLDFCEYYKLNLLGY